MAKVTAVEEDGSQLLNDRRENKFDEYLVLIIGIDDDDDLFENLPRFISKDLVRSFKDIKTICELINSTNIFLIISDKLIQEQVDEFVNKQRIISFYVYCKSKDTDWTKRNETTERIVSNSIDLLKQLHHDINILSHRWSLTERSFQKALTNESQWYHLFLTIICYRSKYSEEYYKEMFDECRRYYSVNNNNHMIDIINKFQEKYKSCNLIREYTCDHFLYRIINHALRTQDMETIKKFGPFINDLISQLVKYYQQYFTSIDFPVRAVYRGQYLSQDELEFLHSVWKSNNPIITLTTFGSTSLDPQVAMDFSGYSSDNRIACLFEIILTDEYNDKQNEIKSIDSYELFGNISCDSAIKDEQEVLFSPGRHFRIRSIEDPIYDSDRQWTPIILEIVIEADSKSHYNYLNIVKQINKNSDPQIYDDILKMLQINAENETRFQQTNWDEWWQALKRQWGKHYLNGDLQPLHLTLYNCFSNDLYWSRKAIEIYKIELLSVPKIQSNRSSFSYLFQSYRSWDELPTLWLALYEDYLKPFFQNTESEEVIKCHRFAGGLYQRIADYQNALECYEKASQININNKYQKNNEIQKQITAIKKDIQRKSKIKHSKKQISTIDQIEQQDQWFISRIIKQWTPEKTSILSVLGRLFKYMKEREKWFDLFYAKIIFSFPLEVTEDLSINDYYLNFFLALQRHLLNKSPCSANNYILSLWRYEKCYSEWIQFQSLKTFLQPFEIKLNYLRFTFLPRLKRFLEKLATILVMCFFYTCVQLNYGEIIINNVPLMNTLENMKMKQSIFFDLIKSSMQVYLETLENECSINDYAPTIIPNNKRFDEDAFTTFMESIS
ncbi:unnamed protein product [Adineta steineri]|uniref:Uncharacterized protein n=1 Tax=Adineta steineri TaxID=433720 RepID=A0A814AVN7_9BILA|nr:unnamed protein product [Adineta steineri]